MTAQYRHLGLVAAIASVAVLVSCSSGGTSQPEQAACATPAIADLGPGTVCVDTGVRPAGLFSFDNWGGHKYAADDFDYSTMAAVFGEEFVCGPSDPDDCAVTSDAVVASDALNELIAGGRCEGLAVLGALYATGRGPDPATYKADSIANLSPINDLFANVIDYWWASQFLSGTLDSSATTRAKSMDDLVSYVIDGLNRSAGLTMGLYFEGRGHSVLPLAVTKTGETTYSIAIWDSNAPLENRFVVIDTANQTWSYENGSVNSDAASETWSGGPGSIDATDIASRIGDPVIGMLGGRGSSVIASGAAGQELSVTVTLDDAREIVASATGTTSAVDGASVSAVKAGDINQYIITLPIDVGSFSVTSTSTLRGSAGAVDSTATSTVAVVRPGTGVVTARTAASSSSSTTVIESGAIDDPASTSVSSDAPVNVQASANDSVIALPLSPDEVGSIAASSDEGIDAVVTVVAGGVTQTTPVPSPDGTEGVQETAITRGSDGSLLAASSPIPSVSIDQAAYAALKSVVTSTAGSGVSDDSARIPDAARQTTSTVESTGVTTTSASVVGRVSSPASGAARIEYSTDDDRSNVSVGSSVSFTAGVDVKVPFTLNGLVPGTTYRYRLAADVGGFTVYSPWASFTTTADQSSDGAAQVEKSTIRDVTSKVFATSVVIGARITVPVPASAFVEYRRADGSVFVESGAQTVSSGRERLMAFALNDLESGVGYVARVGVRIGEAVKYSPDTAFTPSNSGSSTPTSTSRIEFDVASTIGTVTDTTAMVGVTISSESGGRLQLEYQADAQSSSTTRSPSVVVSAGRNVRVWLTLADLTQGTRYRVRPVFVTGSLPVYGTFIRVSTLSVSAATPPSTPPESDANSPSVSDTSDTSVNVSVPVPSTFTGTVQLEYGRDRADFTVLPWPIAQPITSGGPNPARFTITGLESGFGYRVRGVLTSADGTVTRTGYSSFATTGLVDEVTYRPILETPIRIAGGLQVSWAFSSQVVPSPVSFEVRVDSALVATVAGTASESDIVGIAVSAHTLSVAAVLPSGQRMTSLPVSFTMGSGPIISSFSFVSATTNSLIFNYSFDPLGDSVAYGVQVTDLNEQLVRAQQGGNTSAPVNGQTLQVTPLTSGTQFKARLVIFVGRAMYTSAWVNVSTL